MILKVFIGSIKLNKHGKATIKIFSLAVKETALKKKSSWELRLFWIQWIMESSFSLRLFLIKNSRVIINKNIIPANPRIQKGMNQDSLDVDAKLDTLEDFMLGFNIFNSTTCEI